MIVKAPEHKFQFLAGGGEMGELTRNYDWSQTSLGTPDQWPQSLKTTLGIILNSKFPMFLFWGEELICFYNDAFRPSLGNNGKHPFSIGKTGEKVWPEIWDTIKPMIDQVLSGGESIWNEDLFLPIYRNGNIEDVYWTFSYSPVIGESGKPEGLFVTCVETTEKVLTMEQLRISEQRLRNLITESTVATAVYTREHGEIIIEMVNDVALNLWERDRSVIGKPLLEVIPELKGQPFPTLLNNVFDTGEAYTAEEAVVYRTKNGKQVLNYTDFHYKPLKSENGVVTSILATAIDVTDKVNARRTTEESERNIRLIIMQAPVSMAIFRGPEYSVEIVNEKALELWGRTHDEVIGKPIMTTIPELQRQGIKELLDDVYTTGKPFSATELPVSIIRNGVPQQTYINFAYEPLHDADGSINGILTVGIEVTEQVLSRHKIEESEERVRSMVESAPFPIGVYVGKEMRIEMANQAILDVWGKGDDVIGKLYREILPELEEQEVFKQLEQVFTTGKAFHAQNRKIDLVVDGKIRPYYFNYSFTPLFDAFGHVYGVMNTAANVTDLNLAKQGIETALEQLHKVTQRLQLALEAGNLGSYEVNLASGLITCNQQCKLNFGRADKDSITYDELQNMVLPEDREERERIVKDAIDNNKVFDVKYRIRWDDGSIHWIHAAGIPIYDNGLPVKVVGVTTNITKQKQFEEELSRQVQERTKELAQKNVELEKMNEELKSFAYVSSHDLQEPLRKIQTFSDRILEKEQQNLSDTGKDYFTRMQNAAKRMQTLIEDLLAYSRTNSAERTFKITDLRRVVKDVKDDFKDQLQAKHATVVTGEMCEANIIPFQFRQLMQNLISNSLKFSSPDREPVISISAEIIKGRSDIHPKLSEKHKYCHITVSDNGIGFEQEYSERIFEVFQRLHSVSDYKGTGIGLAIVKKIVENHEGVITATSEPDKGATFDIYIPA